MSDPVVKICERCRTVYDVPAEKRVRSGLVLLVCPKCGCRWAIEVAPDEARGWLHSGLTREEFARQDRA
jgi:RNase P subunit RPR2